MLQPRRQNWGVDHQILPELDLLAIQKESYEWFLREGIGQSLQEINNEEGIQDYTGKNWSLKFGKHQFEEPRYSPEQAKRKGVSYEMSLRVEATLTNKRTGEVQTQEVFLGELPKMTEFGTFIIHGIERAVVTQLVRSPGVFFSSDIEPATGKKLHYAELRPLRGSWLELNVGKRDVITVKIDRKRKLPITTLLRALGYESNEAIEALFQDLYQTPEQVNHIAATLQKDTTRSENEALVEIYEKMRPGEPISLESAKQLLFQLFFDARRYDLGEVGRYKLNRRLKIEVPQHVTVLTKEDVVAAVRYLVQLQQGKGKIDDIDHLSNRRVRRVGELVQVNAFRIGLVRLEKSIREKMSLTKTEELLTPAALVNARPLIATISEFFRRNRLSAILDQTNPLSEVDNLRRLSVMGSGGVTRERASFSMRDINASQYSRIDPVRSPEGANIGLVTYLSLYARVNAFGFLEGPYRKVENKNGKMMISDEISYLSADEEEDLKITHASVEMDKNAKMITQEWVPIRHMNEFTEGPVTEVQYVDVVPRQVVGTSASLIPFIAHDEANRALMGTHMQCQAVPLLRPQAPIVGTGMEGFVASAMGRTLHARHAGEVEFVDGTRVVIKLSKKDAQHAEDLQKISEIPSITVESGREIYQVEKFVRTAQSTSYSQRPTVKVGQMVEVGDVVVDGPSTDGGELSLGTNLLIAYASYEGLGYEDAIVISDRVVKEDLLTSVHISEHRAQVMDTKLGPEELTNDIPNVADTFLSNLTPEGIIRIGSVVSAGDILIGKIAPKGETELTPEERLLRAIFGEKSREVKDTSLRMPHGESGVVIDVHVLDRDLGDELDSGVNKEVIVRVAQLRKITVGDKLAGRHGNKGVISKIVPVADMPHLEDGTPVDIIISPLSVLARMNLGQLLEAHLGWAAQKLGYKAAIPAFEHVDENKIWQELERAGLPASGKVRLVDGRTGERFGEDTVVGVAYILKLIHMVEDKTHARSTGPYSLVTQQPLGGRAQMGGQRLGEMEVWALEAHRAARILQEMLTIKSDDVDGRTKAFEGIVKGQPFPDPAVTASFQVFEAEVMSLGLNLKKHGQKVLDQPEEAPAKNADELSAEDMDAELIADVADGDLEETDTPDADADAGGEEIEEPSMDALAQPEEEIA